MKRIALILLPVFFGMFAWATALSTLSAALPEASSREAQKDTAFLSADQGPTSLGLVPGNWRDTIPVRDGERRVGDDPRRGIMPSEGAGHTARKVIHSDGFEPSGSDSTLHVYDIVRSYRI